jgi:hypothetical protein
VVGAPDHTEPQPHLGVNFPTIAWNNLSVSGCCFQITDKMKELVHVAVQTWGNGVPIIYSGASSQPWVGSGP